MLTRFTQFGLAFALVSFAGLGVAQAQDEDPCADDPCADPCAEGDPCADPCADPCSDGDPCADADPCADGGGEEGGDDMGGEGMAGPPPMVTPKGKIAINAVVGVNLSADAVAKPIHISPDVVYGVMPKLSAGLYHSNYGRTGFWYDGGGGGICVTGEENGCAELYNGPTGILARYELANGKMSMAGNGGLILTNIIDDADIGINIKAGVDIRYMLNEKMVIMASPNVLLNLSDRDVFTDGLNIPVALMYAVNEKLHAGVQTGIYTFDLGEIADTYAVPLALAAMMKIDDKLAVGGAFALPVLVNAFDAEAADARTLTVFAMYHL